MRFFTTAFCVFSISFASFAAQPTTLELSKKLLPPGKADDSAVRREIHARSHRSMTPGMPDSERAGHEKELLQALDKNKHIEIKRFLISEIKTVGSKECLDKMSMYLKDEQLCNDAAMALLSISLRTSKNEIQDIIAKAYLASDKKTSIPLAKACGSLTIPRKEVCERLAKDAKNSQSYTRLLYLHSLANIGIAGYEQTILAELNQNSLYHQGLALEINLLYTQKLAEKNNKAGLTHFAAIKKNVKNKSHSTHSLLTETELKIDPSAGIASSLPLLAHKNIKVRYAITRVLKKADKKAHLALVKSAKGKSGKFQAQLIQICKTSSPELARDTITKGFESGDIDWLMAAIQESHLLKAEEVVHRLLKLLSHKEESIGQAAQNALLKFPSDIVANSVLGEYQNTKKLDSKLTLLGILVDSKAKGYAELFLNVIQEDERKLKKLAAKYLKSMATSADIGKILVQLKNSKASSTSRDLQSALVNVLNTSKNSIQDIQTLSKELDQASAEYRDKLLQVLARNGKDTSVQVIGRWLIKLKGNELTDAIRALGKCDNPLAAKQYIAVLKTELEDKQRILATRNILSLIQSSEMPKKLKLKYLKELESMNNRDEESQQISQLLKKLAG